MVKHTPGVSLSTQFGDWARVAQTSANPLDLNDETLEKSLKACPPIQFKGGTFLGRYIIPDPYVRYNPEEQPRDKSNDPDHVNNLQNSYEVQGYLLTSHPPIASFDEKSLDDSCLRGQSGYNRYDARTKYGQEVYIYDVYQWDSPYWEIVARNQANHHQNPQLSQTKHDYLKEVCNAVNAGIVPATEEAIDEFVDEIATDKTAKIRKWIKKEALKNCKVYPNFRTFHSTGKGNNTLTGFLTSQGYAEQGIGGDVKAHGYITYCAGNGDNLQSWARGVQHGTNNQVPVWVFGYATNRVPDLVEFRKGWVDDFNSMKETFVSFANDIVSEEDSQSNLVNEDAFPVKFAGFLPQYVKPNPHDEGKATENTLVDVYGNSIPFDPDGDCRAFY